MKLTELAISKAIYSGHGGNDIRMDTAAKAVPGLALRIYPSGMKSFVLRYSFHGRKQLMTVGKVGAMSLLEARTRARKLMVQVADGVNPLAEKRMDAQAGTVKQLCADYMERHSKGKKKSWQKDQSHIDRHILPAWGNLRPSDVVRADVAALHGRIGKSAPYEANRCLALVSVIFKLAKIWGDVPADHVNPAQDIPHFKERSRDRFVSVQELPKLVDAIDAEESLHIRSYFHLLLLTGMRKSELLEARWDNVDFDRQELRLPDPKQGKVHYVPLTPPAIAILQALPRAGQDIFPVKAVDNQWRRIRSRAGMPGLRIHDLRRSVGSWLAMSGASLALIGKVLGHSNPATTAIYARFSQDAVRDAMDRHSVQIQNVSNGQSAEIFQIGSAA